MSTVLDRMVKRNFQMSARRPPPPREVQYDASTGALSWLPPADRTDFTHYRIRVGTDFGPPNYEVSAGQTSFQIWSGSVFYVSTYNQVNGTESELVRVDAGEIGTIPRHYGLAIDLADPTTEIESPASTIRDGDDLLVFIYQGDTDGREITWSTDFGRASTEIETTKEKDSTFMFRGRNGKWHQVCQHLTGQDHV